MAKIKECPSCALEYDAEENPEVCPYCGYEFPQRKASVQSFAILFAALLLLWALYELIRFVA